MADFPRSFKPMRPDEFLILLYHGVYPDSLKLEGRNGSGKHIPSSEFRRQMQIIKEKWTPVSIPDIAAVYRGERELPPRAVAVTFDDGYQNVYKEAWPILSELAIPFAVYLTTSWIGTGEHSWTDELEDMFWGTTFTTVLPEFKAVLKQVSFEEVEQFMGALKSKFWPCLMDHPLYQMLTWEMVQEMARDPLVSIGAHTRSHVPLARVPYQRAVIEIGSSLADVSLKTGKPCDLFSYPEGQEGDINIGTVSILRARELFMRTGVGICPTAIPGLNNGNDADPYRLYRCAPGLGGQPFPLD